MAEPRFKVGDVVMLKAGIAQAQLSAQAGGEKEPNVGIVVERLTQECPGGVQFNYRVGRVEGWMNEIELCDPKEWDAKANALVAAKVRREINDVEFEV